MISRHPADSGKVHEDLQSEASFYEALERCDGLISRFGSGPLEALAMKKHLVYYNPHGEEVDKYLEPLGCYPIARSENGLVQALSGLSRPNAEAVARIDAFLDHHTGAPDRDPYETLAGLIADQIEQSPKPDLESLRSGFARLDAATAALSDQSVMRYFLASYGRMNQLYRSQCHSSPAEAILAGDDYFPSVIRMLSRHSDDRDKP